jgi:hypothetical protein
MWTIGPLIYDWVIAYFVNATFGRLTNEVRMAHFEVDNG